MPGRKAKRILTNIRPREVSHVDEAANEEDFLFFKSKGGDAVDKEQELFEAIGEVQKSLLDSETDGAEVTKVTEEYKAVALKSVRGGIERLLLVAKAIEKLETFTPDSDETTEKSNLPDTVMTEMKDVVTSLFSVIAKGKEEQLEKAGRKMSKDKLKKLKDALSLLEGLINEVEPVTDEKKSKVQKQTNGGEVMENNTTEEVTEQVTDEVTEPVTEPAAEVTPTTEVSAEPETQESEVLKAIGAMDKKIDGKLDDLGTRVEKLEKNAAAPGPASVATDESEEVETEVKKEKPKSLFHNIIHQ